MPARAALIGLVQAIRVIKRANNHQPGTVETPEEAVVSAYQQLADTIGATVEVTLDGQIIIYTGYFKPSLQGTIDLYEPKPIEFEAAAANTERNMAICVNAGRYVEAREDKKNK